MTICPKCQYKRKAQEEAPAWQCPSCGVVYSKVMDLQEKRGPVRAKPEVADAQLTMSADKSLFSKIKTIMIWLFVCLIIYRVVIAVLHKASPSAAIPTPQSAAASLATKADAGAYGIEQPGFQGIPWGAGEAAILAKFGNLLTRLDQPDTFSNAHVNLIIEQYRVGNLPLKVSFQMRDDTNQLYRVLLSKYAQSPSEQGFVADYKYLLGLITQKLGEPVLVGESKYRWVVGDTKIELGYLYQQGIMENLSLMYQANN